MSQSDTSVHVTGGAAPLLKQVNSEAAMQSDAHKLQYLVDRAEITDLIGRYAFSLDMRDWALFRSCWNDEIEIDMAAEADSPSNGVRTISADDWVRASEAFMKNMPQSQHLKIPILFDIQSDRATVTCIMQGKHWMPNREGGPMSTVVGYYRDKYIRTEAGWKQYAFKEITHWNEGNWHVTSANLQNFMTVFNEALERPLTGEE